MHPRATPRSLRAVARLAALLAALLVAPRSATAQAGVVFGPPHAVRRPAARLDAAAQAAIASALAAAHPRTTDEAVAFALAQSGRALHFGLGHHTSLAFAAPEREGNCVEYAHYFGWAFEQAARAAGLRARAYVVRSDATVFGRHLPVRGLADHDWVLVVDPATGRRWYVDPSFGDASLGWDIAARVRGPVRLP